MNKAKKLAKNNGIAMESKKVSGGESFYFTKNKVLAMLGIAAVIILCAGVCYMQLRPRAVLKVTGPDQSGSDVTNTVYMKETVYDIFQVESCTICTLPCTSRCMEKRIGKWKMWTVKAEAGRPQRKSR